MSSLKSKSRSLKDLYFFYPHKINPPYTTTIPLPFVKKDQLSDHKWAITFPVYVAVITDIIAAIIDRLQKGETWTIGNNLGSVVFTKKKCRVFVDRIKSGEAGKQVKRFKNEYENYMILPQWNRAKALMQNKWLWRFKIVPKVLREIYERTDEDYTYIYKFRDK